jgi:hypothetical protein
MTDFKFLEHKAAEVSVEKHTGSDGSEITTYTGVFQLQDDYQLALERFGGGSLSAAKPLILTGVDFHDGNGPVIRCPWCDTTHRSIRSGAARRSNASTRIAKGRSRSTRSQSASRCSRWGKCGARKQTMATHRIGRSERSNPTDEPTANMRVVGVRFPAGGSR